VTIPLPAGQTPYVTSDQLLNGSWPTGVSFASLPPGRTTTDNQHIAAVTSIAAQATSQADAYCNQPLRCTLTSEFFHGPGDSDARVTVQVGAGMGRVVLQRLPVLMIDKVQVSPNRAFPRQWTVVPANNYVPEYPALGLYNSIAPSAGGQGGQAILVAPGYINWCSGRNGLAIQVDYTHGWPHCSLTASATAATSILTVDDCSGWAITTAAGSGASGVIYDGGNQEAFHVTASSVTAGPGTLTLSSPLQYSHGTGVMVSSFPQNIIWATALFAAAAALTRGATATTLQTAPGMGTGTKGPEELANEAEVLLHPYRRVI
jgi:hypothetical protein